mgnify:CR=1 FL=1
MDPWAFWALELKRKTGFIIFAGIVNNSMVSLYWAPATWATQSAMKSGRYDRRSEKLRKMESV